MKTILNARAATALVLAATFAACSNDSTGSTTGGSSVTLSVVNALAFGIGAQFKLDQSAVALPAPGQSSNVTVTTGSHRVQLLSVSGKSLIDTSISVTTGSRHTVVLTGPGDLAAGVSIAADTITTNNSGSGYQSHSGSLLLVNSAPNMGPYDVRISWGTDSTVRLGGFAYGAGSLPPPAPYSYYLPFEPGQLVVNIVAPGGTTPIATTTFALAINDRWTIVLTTSLEGELTLLATKQP